MGSQAFPFPSNSQDPSEPAARAALNRIAGAVAVASGLAATGRPVELEGIDAMAGRLCAQVLDLSPASQRAFRPSLVALDEALANLSRLLNGPPGRNA